MKKKITLATGVASVVLAWSAFGQDPSAAPAAPTPPVAPSLAASVTPVVTPSATASASASAKEDLEARIERKVKHGVSISLGPDRVERHIHHNSDDGDLGALVAIPIVAIIFGTLFFAPVMIVAAILFFNFLRQRSLHRTVRMMVEKGQPVPPALFSAPPVVRARSDMRRGVVLTMIGIGLMMFFGAVSGWDGGVWTLGLIPFLMGAGYLTVWKLEGHKANAITTNTSTDNIPPVA
ncbi:MAG: DUF6249 domain-containing protein [Chthoniobacterales bacterium]